MSAYDNFILRSKIAGGSMRQSKINDARYIEQITNEEDPSYCGSVYRWINGREPRDGNHIHPRLYSRKWSSANGHTMMMKTLIDEPVQCGDTFHNVSDDSWWICTEADNIDDINYISKLTECNYCLRWQDENLDILEYMCYNQNSTQYNSGVEAERTTTLTSAQHMLTLPLVPDVMKLPYDKKFFLTYDYENSPYVYSLTQNDMTSYKGLCKITVTQTEKSDADNTVLGICNYIDPVLKPYVPEQEDPDDEMVLFGEITCRGQKLIVAGGNAKTFDCTFYDEENNVVNSVDFTWDWSIDDRFVDDVSVSVTDDYKLKVKIIYADMIVGEYFTIIIRDKNGERMISDNIEIGGGL